jgi:hypothetical protein
MKWGSEFKGKFVPCTPAGTFIFNLASNTKTKAIKKLLIDANHMPYKTWENFKKRGYTIEKF